MGLLNKKQLIKKLGDLPWDKMTFGIIGLFYGFTIISIISGVFEARAAEEIKVAEARMGTAVWTVVVFFWWGRVFLMERRLRKLVSTVLESRRKVRETDQKLQALIHVLDRLDEETLKKHGITIEERNA